TTQSSIELDGKPEYAVIPYKEYKRLAAVAEDAEDIRAFDKARTSDEDLIPAETVHRLVERENPIKVWREYRGLTQMQLRRRPVCGSPISLCWSAASGRAQWLSYA
ncbi:MAG: hypothetical protein ACREV8_03340, partial [Gammaproteobacteria bacterium]